MTPTPLRHLPAKPLDNNQATHEFIDKVFGRMRDILSGPSAKMGHNKRENWGFKINTNETKITGMIIM